MIDFAAGYCYTFKNDKSVNKTIKPQLVPHMSVTSVTFKSVISYMLFSGNRSVLTLKYSTLSKQDGRYFHPIPFTANKTEATLPSRGKCNKVLL